MKDTEHRLSYSLSDKEFNITDNRTGDVIRYNGASFTAFTIDKEIVIAGLQNLLEMLSTWKYSATVFFDTAPYKNNLVILENSFLSWSMYLDGITATAGDGKIRKSPRFNEDKARSIIARCLGEIMRAGGLLKPKADIVRRIADAGLLVWVHGATSCVCYEKDVSGMTMSNCLVNGEYYEALLVSVSSIDQRVTLFTSELQEVAEFPYDKSIGFFYKPDEVIFDKGGETDVSEQH